MHCCHSSSSFRGTGENPASFFGGGTAAKSSGLLIKVVLVLLGAACLFGAYSCFSRAGSPRISAGAAAKRPAPAARLATGANGSLADHRYVVVAQNVIEVARTGGRHDRREYLLSEDSASPALLVNGLSGGAQEWHLLRETPVPSGLTPHDAATRRKGSSVEIAGRTLRVTELFLGKILSGDSRASATGPGATGTIHYGFVGREAGDVLVARWTENQIQFFRGTTVPETDVLAAFRPAK